MESPTSKKKGNWYSEIVWAVLIGLALIWEMIAVLGGEKKWGIEPLTRHIRDRGMKKSMLVSAGVFGGLAWLFLHFFMPGAVPFA